MPTKAKQPTKFDNGIGGGPGIAGAVQPGHRNRTQSNRRQSAGSNAERSRTESGRATVEDLERLLEEQRNARGGEATVSHSDRAGDRAESVTGTAVLPPCPVLSRTLAPASYTLSIPTLDPRIPSVISISAAGSDDQIARVPNASALIAEALLREGILRETDWCGSFEKSIKGGLTRWANKEMGADKWRLFDALRIHFTDDGVDTTEEGEMDAAQWHERFNGDEDAPVGFFALLWHDHAARGVNVRRRTLELEKVFPGLGFRVMALLEHAGEIGVNVHTFWWAKNLLMEWDDCRDEEDLDAEGSTILTLKRFEELIPEGAHTLRWSRELAEKALLETERPCRRRYRAVIEAMLELDRLVTESDQRGLTADHLGYFSSYYYDVEHHPTVYTYWYEDTEDPMHRVIDDYYVNAMEGGNLTSYPWLHGFQIHTAGKVQMDRCLTPTDGLREADGTMSAAIHQLETTMATTNCMEQILNWLDDSNLPPEEEKKPRQRRSKTLAQVFAAQAEAGREPVALITEL